MPQRVAAKMSFVFAQNEKLPRIAAETEILIVRVAKSKDIGKREVRKNAFKCLFNIDVKMRVGFNPYLRNT